MRPLTRRNAYIVSAVAAAMIMLGVTLAAGETIAASLSWAIGAVVLVSGYFYLSRRLLPRLLRDRRITPERESSQSRSLITSMIIVSLALIAMIVGMLLFAGGASKANTLFALVALIVLALMWAGVFVVRRRSHQ